MTTYICLYNGPTLRNEFEIHKTDCRDIKQHKNSGVTEFPIEGGDVIEAVQREIDVYQDQDQGWDWGHFTIMPCSR
jgi:hypothetical protein